MSEIPATHPIVPAVNAFESVMKCDGYWTVTQVAPVVTKNVSQLLCHEATILTNLSRSMGCIHDHSPTIVVKLLNGTHIKVRS